MAGLKCAPDCFPQGERTIATMAAPIAIPISNRRTASLARKRWIGEAGCHNRVATAHAENRYRPDSAASIKYSGQWSRKPCAALSARLLVTAACGSIRGCRCVVNLPGMALDLLRYGHEQAFEALRHRRVSKHG